MYDSIPLPTDGSDTADLAAERAIDMADRHDAVLHVRYVAERTRDEPTQTGLEEKLTAELDTGGTSSRPSTQRPRTRASRPR